MTDLVARVLLKADSSGLVGQVRPAATAIAEVGKAAATAGAGAKAMATDTAAAATAVSEAGAAASTAGAAVGELGKAKRQAGAAAKALAAEVAGMRSALEQAAVRTAALDTANGELTRELRQAQTEAAGYARELRDAQAASAQLAGRVDVLETRLRESNRTHREGAAALDRHSFGARNLGQQFGDLGLSIAGGISPARAFGQQAGQMGYALSEMGGKAGAVGAFLTGPWGIALTIGAAVLAPFVEELFSGGQASDALKDKSLSLEDALDKQAFATDAARKALADYNAQQDQAKQRDSLATDNALRLADARLKQARATIDATNALIAQARAQLEVDKTRASGPGQRGELGALAAGETANRLGQLESLERQQRNSAAAIEQAQRNLYIEKAGRTAAAAVDPVKRLNDQYDQMRDRAIRAARANTELAKSLDAKLTAIERSRAAAVKQTQEEKRAAERKPSRTSLGDQLTGEQGGRLLASAQSYSGLREDRAGDNSQLRALFSEAKVNLDPKMVAWCAAFVNAVLATNGLPGTGSLSARSFLGYGKATDKPVNGDIVVLKRGGNESQGHVGFYAGERGGRVLVTGGNQSNGVSTAGYARSDVLGFRRAPSAADSYRSDGADASRAAAAKATAARELDTLARQLTAAFDPGKAAADAYLDTLGKINRALAGGALTPKEADAVRAGALREYLEQVPVGPTIDEIVQQTTDSFRDRLGDGAQNAGDRLRDGTLRAAEDFREAIGEIGDLFGGQVGSALRFLTRSKQSRFDQAEAFARGFDPIIHNLNKSLKLGLSDDQAGRLGKSIGEKAGKTLAGAQDGAAVAGIANSLGLKVSGTGAQIGGALGGFLGSFKSITKALGPFGELLGPGLGLVGGIVGKLLGGSKTSSAAITTRNGQFAAGDASGSSGALKQQATGLAGAVSSGLQQIAQQLGGGVGDVSGISIGTKNGKFHVNAVGGQIGKKGSGDIGFGKDGEAEAIAYAIQQAVLKGAVTGLSQAVQQALRSSTDVNAALAEAVKVREVEGLLGGVTGQLKRLFGDFATTAAERVRLARAYGLDLIEVERINAEQRASLLDETLKSRVGALKDLLKNLQYGDLFEGDAATRRKAILAEIGEARTDADAGVDGAAARLADLIRTLVSTSKEAFGTAGPEYESDRALGVAEIERVVKIENDRIAAASAQQQATTDAVKAGNALIDEGNDLLAEQNRFLASIAASLTGGGGSVAINLAAVERAF